MSVLSLNRLTVRRRGQTVVDGVTLDISAGEVVGLIGPNGAGKTTLMRGALGLLPVFGHSSLTDMAPRARARHAAWLPQRRDVAWPVTVETLVALGRTPYLAGGRKLSIHDRQAVADAIRQMDLGALSSRMATELSGGEQARALIARVLAQETPLIMADEPVTGLDPAHQFALMRVFTQIAGEGRSIFVSLHDLGLAAQFCSRLILLEDGRVVAGGPPEEVLSSALLDQVFGVSGQWSDVPGGRAFQPLERAAP